MNKMEEQERDAGGACEFQQADLSAAEPGSVEKSTKHLESGAQLVRPLDQCNISRLFSSTCTSAARMCLHAWIRTCLLDHDNSGVASCVCHRFVHFCVV